MWSLIGNIPIFWHSGWSLNDFQVCIHAFVDILLACLLFYTFRKRLALGGSTSLRRSSASPLDYLFTSTSTDTERRRSRVFERFISLTGNSINSFVSFPSQILTAASSRPFLESHKDSSLVARKSTCQNSMPSFRSTLILPSFRANRTLCTLWRR